MKPGFDLTTRPALKLAGLLTWHTALVAACLPAAVAVAAVAAPVGLAVVGVVGAKRAFWGEP